MGKHYPPIADYGLIGDCHTAALIARDASIDWFCPGRFDAPAVFCRMLDADHGGYLKTAPSGSFSVERRYRAETNVLETTLDATALVIPRIGFLPPTDARVRSTVDQIKRHLSKNGLVFRYRNQDGLAGGEGTFTLCSSWLVDALALGGKFDEARSLFDRVTGYANDLGLLAEEIDAESGEQLGNYPQGFSQLAVIGA